MVIRAIETLSKRRVSWVLSAGKAPCTANANLECAHSKLVSWSFLLYWLIVFCFHGLPKSTLTWLSYSNISIIVAFQSLRLKWWLQGRRHWWLPEYRRIKFQVGWGIEQGFKISLVLSWHGPHQWWDLGTNRLATLHTSICSLQYEHQLSIYQAELVWQDTVAQRRHIIHSCYINEQTSAYIASRTA